MRHYNAQSGLGGKACQTVQQVFVTRYSSLLGLVVALGLSAAPAATQGQQASAGAESGSLPQAFDLPAVHTVLGDVIPVGQGTARSWLQLDEQGNPAAIGITLTEAALNGLPADVTPGLVWAAEYILALPSTHELQPFNHIGLNWNPRGHVPEGIYDAPHFDVHFYMISPDVRRRISARGDDLDKIRTPLQELGPDGFIFAPDSEEPGMGGHWVDPVGPEFQGHEFTSTFIYGSYEGEVVFYEPMINKAYLETRPNVTVPLKMPRRYGRDGYYPTNYSISFDTSRGEYTVALDGLTLRRAN